ncbi:PREDICTED: rho guanine nucleotide exchange factor 2-like isoform X2 [Nicrophorus vespilloides]|uniref:Rho guanine nucleotide exchange factor 2-like isoform X2 n=1 Tax=Nicrophorus vespilloides TaxID=110193 RepID=A0ABM1MDS2_NICVS|nr:PREDICTED: rho guanine nucleotide exchange factor 2-like isoform X2 [Nicrophorus vespilloides]
MDAISEDGDQFLSIPDEFETLSQMSIPGTQNLDDDSDCWSLNQEKETLEKLDPQEIKMQELIHEFILTEKHYCLVLLTIQQLFCDGFSKFFASETKLRGVFIGIDDLIQVHTSFLDELTTRQEQAELTANITDILAGFFGNSSKLKQMYGDFCKNSDKALKIYKFYLETDYEFEKFINSCQKNPLLKRKSLPDCLLLIEQRLIKYQLLISAMLKTNKSDLNSVHDSIKDILFDVNQQIEEQQNALRKVEICHKLDDKSYTIYKGHQFSKFDMQAEHRKLIFEGEATLNDKALIRIVVLSDLIVFLREVNGRYELFMPENKIGAFGLDRVLVRKKAGLKSIFYLISSDKVNPQIHELHVLEPKDVNVWIKAIQDHSLLL